MNANDPGRLAYLLTRRDVVARIRSIESALEDLAMRKVDEHGEKRRACDAELDIIERELGELRTAEDGVVALAAGSGR